MRVFCNFPYSFDLNAIQPLSIKTSNECKFIVSVFWIASMLGYAFQVQIAMEIFVHRTKQGALLVGLLLVLWPLPRGLPNTFINLAAWENLEQEEVGLSTSQPGMAFTLSSSLERAKADSNGTRYRFIPLSATKSSGHLKR